MTTGIVQSRGEFVNAERAVPFAVVTNDES